MKDKHTEEQIWKKLRDEKITIPNDIKTRLFDDATDGLSAIKLIIANYLEDNQAVPPDAVKKMFEYNRNIYNTFAEFIKPAIIKTETRGVVKINNGSARLNFDIKALTNHYLGNVFNAMEMIFGALAEDDAPLSVEDSERIVGQINTAYAFLIKLKDHTASLEERIRNLINLPLVFIENVGANVKGLDKEKLEKSIASLKEIEKLLDEQNG
jgi:hypothetical protein